MVDKAPDAYRTISEVADDLDLPQHVLRFWETRFAQIRPLKRGGGRRYYRPEDIDLLKGIRHLLYGEGYTIRGVQRIIKESGVKSIQAIGRGEGAAGLPKPGGPEILDPAGDEPETGGLRASLRGLFRSAPEPVRSSPSLAVEADAVAPSFHEDSYGQRPFAAQREEPYLAPNAPRAARPDEVAERDDLSEPAREWHPAPAASVARATIAPAPVARPAPPAPAPMVAAPPHRPVVTPYAPPPVPAPPQAPATARLAAEDIRRLQSALYELGECRKRLDQAFEPR